MVKRCRITRRRCKDTRCYRKTMVIKRKNKRCPKGTRKCRDNRCHKKR